MATVFQTWPWPTFTPMTSRCFWAMGMGDFNGDRRPDLAVANYGSSSVSVLINNTPFRDVSFQQPRNFAAGDTPFSVAVGDFNGDGVLDLAVANYVAVGSVTLLLGNSAGTFQAPRVFETGGRYPFSVAVGD